MLREGLLWFGGTLTKTVTVTSIPTYGVTIVSNDIPVSMMSGQSYAVHVTVRNTGSNVWTASAGYKLGSPGDSDPFAFPRVPLDALDSIGYGQEKTFTFTMTAPPLPGTYITDWMMLREGVTWFGQTLSLTVTVAGPVDNAMIVSDTIPSAMTAGQSYTVAVTLRNTGTSTWTQTGNYKLGAVGDSDPFSSARQELASLESIAPGQEKTFTFVMTAPTTPGSYVTDWRMLRELVAWFGGTLSKTLIVSSTLAYDAVIVSEDIPSTMVAGQSYVVTIRVRNLGSNAWAASNGYKLGSPGDSDPFAYPRQELNPSDIIEGGQEKVFTFTMTAPSTPGTYQTDWRMLIESVTWFGATLKKTITVTQ